MKGNRVAIGIDLGTTNSCMAIFENGEGEVIENSEGARTTPSVVAFKENDERITGAVAYRQAVTNPEDTISSVKRFMGRKNSEVSEEEKIVPYEIKPGKDDAVTIQARGKDYSPPEISAIILQKLKSDAEEKLGMPIHKAVITVPAYFNDDQRQATKDAGRIAGLEVERIINEPTAAALAYGLHKSKSEEKILVFDLGGGTFDVSFLEIADGVFEVMSTSGDNHLGGDNWDANIVEYLAKDFLKDQGVDLREDKNALQRLYEAAEKAKIELSSVTDTVISLPFITALEGQPKHLETKLTRATLDEITRELLDRVIEPVQKSLSDAGNPSLDHVILVGGMTRMPSVRAKVKALTNSDPHQGVNPDEVVAIGAAIQAGVLAGDVGDVLLLDVTPLSLGLETKGGIMTPLIERNTTIPTNRTEIFSTAEDDQYSVEIHVMQGERSLSEGNKSLGRFELRGITPAPRGIPQIEVTFDIDVDGLLTVSAKDLSTGSEQKLEVKGGSGLTDAEIEEMIAEAQKHSESDKALKELAEAINSAEATINTGGKVLEEARDHEDWENIAGDLVSKSEEEKKALREELERSRQEEQEVSLINRQTAELNSLNSDYQTTLKDISETIYSVASKEAKASSQAEEIIDAEIVDDEEPETVTAEEVTDTENL